MPCAAVVFNLLSLPSVSHVSSVLKLADVTDKQDLSVPQLSRVRAVY